MILEFEYTRERLVDVRVSGTARSQMRVIQHVNTNILFQTRASAYPDLWCNRVYCIPVVRPQDESRSLYAHALTIIRMYIQRRFAIYYDRVAKTWKSQCFRLTT